MNVSVIEVEVVTGSGDGVLEVTLARLEGDKDSDNIRDHIRILSVKLFVAGMEIDLDIDVDQVYSVVSAAIRNAGLSAMFNEEDGGF